MACKELQLNSHAISGKAGKMSGNVAIGLFYQILLHPEYMPEKGLLERGKRLSGGQFAVGGVKRSKMGLKKARRAGFTLGNGLFLPLEISDL